MKKTLIAKAAAASTLLTGFSALAAEGDATSHAKAAFESLGTQATEMSGYAWGLVVLVVGATVGIKLFKKFVSRAS